MLIAAEPAVLYFGVVPPGSSCGLGPMRSPVRICVPLRPWSIDACAKDCGGSLGHIGTHMRMGRVSAV